MLLPALATGISNRMFANGIAFVGDERSRYKMEEWAEETNLIKTLKKAYMVEDM
jgi:hypothetical protein